jgi:hypothetical protein
MDPSSNLFFIGSNTALAANCGDTDLNGTTESTNEIRYELFLIYSLDSTIQADN